jgi:hypothetical protein
VSPTNLPWNVTKANGPKQDQFAEFWSQRNSKPKSVGREFSDRDIVLRSIVSHKQGRVLSARIIPECV